MLAGAIGASVARAGVAVIAALGGSGAAATAADIQQAAAVTVIAGDFGGKLNAALIDETCVRGADIAVLALEWRPTETASATARIVDRARVAIAAGRGLGQMRASARWLTGVSRAVVAVIAAQRLASRARTALAVIRDAADVAVVAR